MENNNTKTTITFSTLIEELHNILKRSDDLREYIKDISTTLGSNNIDLSMEEPIKTKVREVNTTNSENIINSFNYELTIINTNLIAVLNEVMRIKSIL